MRQYCYKVKWPLLKVKENNAYAHAQIEKFGFAPMFETFDDGVSAWAEGWARNVTLPATCSIGKWIRSNIESIYKSEKDKSDSKWLKEILNSGYEFDADGKLIENEKAMEDISAQLCVMQTGELRGTLFLNIGGALEIYSVPQLDECVGDIVKELFDANAIYKKVLSIRS